METTAFRQFLESLCSNSPWSYAVFWKLQQVQEQILLIYEDGYCNYNVSQLQSQSILGRYSGQEGILNLGFRTDIWDGDLLDDPIMVGSDDISSRQYVLGQGLVGRVALSGDDLWLFSDDAESIELISFLEPNPDEWLLPSTGGIKTTFIAPVFPYGVLQLGSFEKVAENVANVADIKDRIIALNCTATPMPSNHDETSPLFSSVQMSEWDNTDGSSFSIIGRTQSQDTKEFHRDDFADIEVSTVYEVFDPLQLDDATPNSLLISDMDISHKYLDLSTELDMLSEFVLPDIPDTFESLWAFCSHEEESVDTGISSESSSGVSSYVLKEEDKQSPAADILREVLEPSFSTENGHSGCSYEAEANSCEGVNLSEKSICGWFDEGGDQDYLLEAAIAALCNNSADTLSYMCNNSRLSATSLAEFTPSLQVQVSDEATTAQTDHDTNASPRHCPSLSGHLSTATKTLTSNSSFDSFETAILEDEQPITRDYEFAHVSVKGPKLKKGRAGQKINLRPRPRDRQLIQDRLKQLRKLVPSGAKSSIDGLLEHTTKHMMFLKGVTEQAKKVKQFTDQKIRSGRLISSFKLQEFLRSCNTLTMQNKVIPERNESNTRRPSPSSLTQQGGGNTESCPIVVTDLEHPGQFLIQMLCKSDEVFFEMIEVIRQLNLSILQGVMEDYCSNRARFIVEASENFNRLDIFWPLMRILQRNGDWMTKMNQWCV